MDETVRGRAGAQTTDLSTSFAVRLKLPQRGTAAAGWGCDGVTVDNPPTHPLSHYISSVI